MIIFIDAIATISLNIFSKKAKKQANKQQHQHHMTLTETSFMTSFMKLNLSSLDSPKRSHKLEWCGIKSCQSTFVVTFVVSNESGDNDDYKSRSKKNKIKNGEIQDECMYLVQRNNKTKT